MRRYAVVAFQTIQAERRGPAEERGGGVCFIPIDDRAEWPTALARIVREHFHHSLGRSLEVGIASLDEESLAVICRRSGEVFWQGGDN